MITVKVGVEGVVHTEEFDDKEEAFESVYWDVENDRVILSVIDDEGMKYSTIEILDWYEDKHPHLK